MIDLTTKSKALLVGCFTAAGLLLIFAETNISQKIGLGLTLISVTFIFAVSKFVSVTGHAGNRDLTDAELNGALELQELSGDSSKLAKKIVRGETPKL